MSLRQVDTRFTIALRLEIDTGSFITLLILLLPTNPNEFLARCKLNSHDHFIPRRQFSVFPIDLLTPNDKAIIDARLLGTTLKDTELVIHTSNESCSIRTTLR
jgi:hypothetical protein